MKPYPKIETLFARGADFVVDPSLLKNPAYGCIKEWVVTEKVDGMNIRVSFTKGVDAVRIGGRSDNASIPADLVARLNDLFPKEKMEALLYPDAELGTEITLYGEGFGGSIQKGGAYGLQKDFILFDIRLAFVDGHEVWLPDSAVTEYANSVGCKRVPILNPAMPLESIVEFVRVGFQSLVAESPKIAEGIVGRPAVPLFDAGGKRIILKLKTSDFHPGVKR